MSFKQEVLGRIRQLPALSTGWTTSIQFLAGGSVQTNSGSHPTSYPVGTVGPLLFPHFPANDQAPLNTSLLAHQIGHGGQV